MYSYFIHFPLTLTFWRLSLAQLVAVGSQGGATGVQYRIPWLEYFESAAAHFNGYCFRSLRKMSQENILSTRRDFFFFFLYKKNLVSWFFETTQKFHAKIQNSPIRHPGLSDELRHRIRKNSTKRGNYKEKSP